MKDEFMATVEGGWKIIARNEIIWPKDNKKFCLWTVKMIQWEW